MRTRPRRFSARRACRRKIMANTILVGAQWGDEGKGKIIDVLTEQADIVVRYAGGNNAGHTIIVGGENVFAAEVEAVLMNHDKVKEAAVRGIPATGIRESPLPVTRNRTEE